MKGSCSFEAEDKRTRITFYFSSSGIWRHPLSHFILCHNHFAIGKKKWTDIDEMSHLPTNAITHIIAQVIIEMCALWLVEFLGHILL